MWRRQQCARLSTADTGTTAQHQLKLYQQRHVVRRYLGVRAAVYVVLLEPRPIWRTKNAKRPQEIPPVKYVVDNASEVKPANAQRNIQRLLKQDLNMVITMLRNAKALFGTSVSSEQHTDGTNQLTRYDFLIVLYGDLRSTGTIIEV